MPLLLREFDAKGYRSLRNITYPVSQLDIFVGANGVGKTNLYRALELVHLAAANRLARDIMDEGGLQSARWAGPAHKHEKPEVLLSVGFSDPDLRKGDAVALRYEVIIGFPPKEASSAFQAEPQIKSETLTLMGASRNVRLMERHGQAVHARGADGRPAQIDLDLLSSETVLGRLEEPGLFPQLDALRRTLLQWRFYHSLRTDAQSPLRQGCLAVATPTLSSDGSDLAAVFATLAHIRQDTRALDDAVNLAFPGARLVLPKPERLARFGMVFPEFPDRVFEASELSDGTLRFLTLAGALMAYRLPPFIALNEPESSLHPDLMEPLAQMIVAASRRTQVWLVTHSHRLAEAIAATGQGKVRTVLKEAGETQVEGLKRWGAFAEDEEED
jgi:predicted ATPase